MNTRKNLIALAFSVLLLTTYACSPGGSVEPGAGGDQPGAVEDGGSSGDSELFAPFAGVASIDLLTLASGAGEKPLFEWTPVEGATRYSLILQFPDGRPYWAWSGDANSVYLGGLDTAPPADAAGPILLEGMTWAVFAFDAEGNMIGSSAVQAISP